MKRKREKTIETKEALNIEDLLFKVNEGGSPNLQDLSESERRAVLDWYKTSDLNGKEQVAYLEEFLLWGASSDEEILALVKNLSPEGRHHVGNYLAKNIEATKYLYTFYECWEEMDYEVKNRFIEKVKGGEFEKMILIAPFFDITTIIDKTKKSEYESSSVAAVRNQFWSVPEASQLFEALINYFENHPSIQEKTDKLRTRRFGNFEDGSRDSMETRYLWGSAINIQKIIKYFKDSGPPVVYLYLDKLVELELIRPEEISALYERIWVGGGSHLTKEEQKEFEEMKKRRKDDYDWLIPRVFATGDSKRARELEEVAKQRDTEAVLTDLKKRTETYDIPRDKFLLALLDRGMPVFSYPEKIGLTNEEIRSLIKRYEVENGDYIFSLWNLEDAKRLIEWGRENPGRPDMESLVLEIIIKNLENGSDGSIGAQLHNLIGWFKEENRAKLLKAILDRAPDLWIYNLKFAMESKIVSFDTIIERMLKEEEYNLLSQFNIILYHSAGLTKRGEKIKFDPKKLKEVARKLILEHPDSIFSESFNYVVNQVFTKEEQGELIESELFRTPANPVFVERIIGDEKFAKYQSVCRRLIQNDPSLFWSLSEYGRTKAINKLLDGADAAKIIKGNVESEAVMELVDGDLVEKLFSSSDGIERIVRELNKSKSARNIANVIRAIDFYTSNEERSIELRLSTKTILIREIKELKEKEAGASRDKKEEIKGKQKELREKLLKLKEEDLKLKKLKIIKERAKKATGELRERLRRLCEEKKFAVFEERVIEIMGEEVEDIVKKEIEEYSTIHPEDLISKPYYSLQKGEKRKRSIKDLIGENMFEDLFLGRCKTITFQSEVGEFQLGKFSSRIMEVVSALDPIKGAILAKDPEKDFYQSVSERLSQLEMYDLYAPKIDKILKEEREFYGVRPVGDYMNIRRDFQELSNKISLLSDSRLVLRNKRRIRQLEEKERESLLDLFELASFYHLDESIPTNIIEGDLSNLKSEVVKRVIDFCKKLFELEEADLSLENPPTVRTLQALSVYFGKSCKKDPKMKESFQRTVKHILEGNYSAWRAWGENDWPENDGERGTLLKNLKQEGLLPDGITLTQYEMWIEDEERSFSETFEYQISDVQIGIKNILSLSIVDGHITEKDIVGDEATLKESYDILLQPLRDLAKRQQELKKRLLDSKKDRSLTLSDSEIEEYEGLKDEIKNFKEENEDALRQIESLRYLNALRRISPSELEVKVLSIDQKKIALTDVFNTLEKNFKEKREFLGDIRKIRALINESNNQIFQGSRISRSDLKVTDRVDAETHVYIGEYPVESCQSFKGSNLNYGLLSYLSDPAVKITQIWDDSGKIIARAVLRLMEGDEGEPAIFMERVYSLNNHPKIIEAVARFAKSKADKLGIDIYTREEEVKEIFRAGRGESRKTLRSKGSRSAYVYTDAGGGKIAKGVFDIKIFT